MTGLLTGDIFLTGRLGRPAFTLATHAVGSVVEADLPPSPAFVTAKLPADDVAASVRLQALGFKVIETALTFEAGAVDVVAAMPAAGAVTIRAAAPADRAKVEAIAGSRFRSSRFHVDPAVPDPVAHALKREWAGNYFLGRRGDVMLVACLPSGEVAGFLQLLARPAGTLVIDLIAVASEAGRRGLARALIAAAVRDGINGQPPERLQVGTQAANIPSCRLYGSMGFRLASAALVLHHHGRPA